MNGDSHQNETTVVLFTVLVLSIATLAYLLFIRALPAQPQPHQHKALLFFQAFFLTEFFAYLLYCLRFFDHVVLSVTFNNSLYLLGTYWFYLGVRCRYQLTQPLWLYLLIVLHLLALTGLMYWFSAVSPDPFIRLPLSLGSFCLPILLTFALIRRYRQPDNPGDKVLMLCALLALLMLPLLFPLFGYLLADDRYGQMLTMTLVTLSLETLCIGGLAIAYIYQLTAKLQHDANTDKLTQCHNRRYFFKMVSQYQQQVAAGLPVSLVLLDIDHFKQLNDRYGHQAGDAVLTHFAALLRGQLSPADLAVRYGGEEFVLLLAGLTAQQARDWLARFRQKLEQSPYVADQDCLAVCASYGVTALGPDNIDRDIRLADQALYQAKALGRDRVVLAGTDGSAAATLPAS